MTRLLALLLTTLSFLLAPSSGEETAAAGVSGVWMDSWSQRARMELTYSDGSYQAVIHWANSAFEYVEWKMTGTFIDDTLLSSDCSKTIHSFSADGSERIEILYENAQAVLTHQNGVITWQDPEGIGAECRFEPMNSLPE